MAGTREISGRIRSVRDTMKITNAMYMISSTKLRKARKEMTGNAPYFRHLQAMLAAIMRDIPDLQHEYLDQREWKKPEEKVRAVLVITADKGLAGAYNHNVLHLVERNYAQDPSVKVYVVGEVGRQFFAGRKVQMAGQFQYTAQNPTLHRARVIAETLLDAFCKGEVDEVSIAYTTMEDGLSSEARLMPLLPLRREEIESRTRRTEEGRTAEEQKTELIFQPSPEYVLTTIVPDLIVGYVYSTLVDSYCSEQNDRMVAMDSANRNAEEMLHELQVSFNRERQAMITQEITEVASGANSIKKNKRK